MSNPQDKRQATNEQKAEPAQSGNEAASGAGRKGGKPQDENATAAGQDSKGRTVQPPGQRAFEEGNESDSRSIEADEPTSTGGRLSQGGTSERSTQK